MFMIFFLIELNVIRFLLLIDFYVVCLLVKVGVVKIIVVMVVVISVFMVFFFKDLYFVVFCFERLMCGIRKLFKIFLRKFEKRKSFWKFEGF